MPARISLHRYFCDVRVLLVICFLAGAGAIASAKAWSEFYTPSAEFAAPSPATPAIESASLSAVQSNGLQRELITIRPSGFEPAEITRPAGRFLLAIENKSGLDEVVLRIRREGGTRHHEGRVWKGNLKWRSAALLSPGRYLLTSPDHPDWNCIITITQ